MFGQVMLAIVWICVVQIHGGPVTVTRPSRIRQSGTTFLKPYRGKCYKFYTHPDSKKQYWEAQRECKKNKGNLAMPKTEEINQFLVDTLLANDIKEEVFIGLDDIDVEKDFKWQDGNRLIQPKFYENFAKGTGIFRKQKGQSRDCVTLDPVSKTWQDIECHRNILQRLAGIKKRRAFVCEHGNDDDGADTDSNEANDSSDDNEMGDGDSPAENGAGDKGANKDGVSNPFNNGVHKHDDSDSSDPSSNGAYKHDDSDSSDPSSNGAYKHDDSESSDPSSNGAYKHDDADSSDPSSNGAFKPGHYGISDPSSNGAYKHDDSDSSDPSSNGAYKHDDSDSSDPSSNGAYKPGHYVISDPCSNGAFKPGHYGISDPSSNGAFKPGHYGTSDPSNNGAYDPNDSDSDGPRWDIDLNYD
ncbi:B.thuringiensis plasmid DNA for cryiic operon and cryiic delta-endotoxin [Plakobranchus ocellatus]|uniref:B.thuringiensis plasmid DNA for cryiic operon and cryiic delta-endotoxin n=1 Tax=Plakobranchus ocellatus TaxID=259542 RepID=A0AAV3ZMU5_9GAST|nr:B.thuringiensis plasmid DNA for cryiic operon and cryiic delta-endotoxin [Plakobranchus ocellatus]